MHGKIRERNLQPPAPQRRICQEYLIHYADEIYEEINLGAVKVYENYANACGLVDSLRLEQLSKLGLI